MGIIIDTEMRSNIPDVYAAGDVVNTSKWTDTGYWYQVSCLTMFEYYFY